VTNLSLSVSLALLLAASTAAAQGPAPEGAPPEARAADVTKPGGAPASSSPTTEATPPTGKGEPVATASGGGDGETKAPPADHEVGEDAIFGHGMQFGIRAGVVFGYRMNFRYDHSPLCQPYDASKGTEQQKVCGFGAPPAAEIGLSFAPLDGIEPYVFGRFGFSGESNTDTNPLRLFGVGARIYTMSDSRLKMFIEPAVAYEAEGGGGNPAYAAPGVEYKKDLVFHVGVGPQYDFAKALGIYLNAGIDVGVLRSISATLLANVGLQLRFP
jgi:opacity protein-like surface antigen